MAGSGKPFRFTRHALDVMAERQLLETWVEQTVRDPEWQQPDPHDVAVLRRFRTIPERGNRVLRVACVETASEIRILSAFLDRRARKPK